MPAAPFSPAPAGEDLAPSKRQREIGPTQCRWIIADEDAGAEALMCGAPVEPRRPFCAAHCARAFLKVEQDGEAESAQDEDGQDENTEREAAE